MLKSEFILLITVSNFFSLALCPLDYNHLPAFSETTFSNRPRELQNDILSVNAKSIFLFKGAVVLNFLPFVFVHAPWSLVLEETEGCWMNAFHLMTGN